jgi:iron complex transport system ATP-binding protein
MAAREHTISVLGNYASAPTAPAVVMVTHHIEEIPKGFTHALILSSGQVYAAGEIATTLTSEKITGAFGFGLEVTLEGDRFRVKAKN